VNDHGHAGASGYAYRHGPGTVRAIWARVNMTHTAQSIL
jgi:hypothetical protein